jgi:hypothetical protein
MACTYDESPAEKAAASKKIRDEIDKLTNLLCGQCRRLEFSNQGLMTFEVKVWWDRHKVKDEERRRKEEFERQEQRNRKLREYEKLKKELGL